MKKLASVILTTLTLTACGDSLQPERAGATKTEAEKTGFALIDAAGSSWTSGCEARDKGRSYENVYAFGLNEYISIHKYFLGGNCEPDSLYHERRYKRENIKIMGSDSLPGWQVVSFDTGASTAAVFFQEIADAYNKHGVYGYTDWAPNSAKDIAGRAWDTETEPEQQPGVRMQQTIKFENGVLTIARYIDGLPSAEHTYLYSRI